jgi:hypothetical protein
MEEILLNAIVTIATGIVNLCRWIYKTRVSILDTMITKQQYPTQYLMKHKLYGCRSIKNTPQQVHNYDTKSYLIGIDKHASPSMTNCESEFIDTPKLANVPIKGINGHLSTSKIGTVRWII